MTDQQDKEQVTLKVSAEDNPRHFGKARSTKGLVYGFLFMVAIAVAAAAMFLGKGLINKEPVTSRDRISAVSSSGAKAVQQLISEPCYQPAVMKLLRAYRAAEMPRDLVDEVAEYERKCAPLPGARAEVLRSLVSLAEFNRALEVANVIVEENQAAPDAWALRASVKEKLKDLEGASADQRQALALFHDPSRIHVSEWYELADLLRRLGRFCEAINPLRTFLSYDPVGRHTQQIQTILSKLQSEGACLTGSSKIVEIRFPPNATGLFVDAKVNGVLGRFIIDTGATTVALSASFAERANIQTDPQKQLIVSTANGKISVTPGVAETISLQGLTAKRVFVGVQPNELGGHLDGLLGLSFIGNFDFQLKDNTITLAIPAQ